MNKRRKNLWLAGIISVVGVIVIATGTVVVLQNISSQKAQVQSAKEAIAVLTQKAPDYFGTANYKKIEKPINTSIRYSGTSRQGYDMYLTAATMLQYEREDGSIKNNDATLVKNYEKLLSEYGLKQTSTNNSVTGYLIKLFENDKVACQTDDWESYTGHTASYGFSCVDKAIVSQAYTDTTALLGQTTADLNASNIQLIHRTFITMKAGKQLQTFVTKQADGTSLTLYFLNTGSGWGYVGMRPTPSVDDKNSFTIPDKLIKTIQASPEKTLLTTYILQGGAS